MNNEDYWKERFEQLEDSTHNRSVKTVQSIDKELQKAQKTIEGQINAWYQRVAKNNDITMQEARKLLTAKELKEFKWDVQEYIKYGRENELDARWLKELENASARVHISRLEQIKLQTQQACEALYGNQLDEIDRHIRQVYQSDYYHTLYEVQRGINVGWNVASVDENLLSKIISKPWAVDGKNFSERIWGSKSQLISSLHTNITQMCMLGQAPDKAIRNIEKAFGSSRYQASRLVMTESAYFSSVARKDALKELDVEEFEVVATLDSHTSEKCRDMDGMHFPMSDFVVGVTAPPFHPNCRTTTCPYFADDVGMRVARDDNGNRVYVPSNMTYKEWKGNFVGENLRKDVPDGKIVRDYQSNMAQKFGKEHYDGMHDLIDSSENPSLKKVWGQYEGDINVADAKYKGRAHCMRSNIYVNGEKDAKGNTWNAPFQVTFHESGHAIDSLASKKASGIGFHYSSRYKDGIFPQTIKDEVQELVDKKSEVIKQEFKEHKGDWKWLSDKGYISKSSYDFYTNYGTWLGGEPKYSKSIAYKAIEKEVNALSPKAKADLSDILEGATGAKINCGFGHGARYWKQKTFDGVSDGLATEAFAEMIDSTMSNRESLEVIKKYLPKSYAIFEEMIVALVE